MQCAVHVDPNLQRVRERGFDLSEVLRMPELGRVDAISCSKPFVKHILGPITACVLSGSHGVWGT